MTNPPFGEKSSVTIVNEKGEAEKESLTIHRDDFWASTSNKHFTLKENQLKRLDLDEVVACYHAENRHQRTESERFKPFTYDDLIKRDKVNLDIFWLKDESLEDSANFPAPEVIAADIMEDLEAALEQFREIANDLGADIVTRKEQ